MIFNIFINFLKFDLHITKIIVFSCNVKLIILLQRSLGMAK